MASITTAQREEILALVVGMIGGSPGATNLSALVRARENGATLQNIADAIATKPQFEAVYPAHMTSDEFADKLVSNLLGTEVTDAAAVTWVKNWIKGQLAAGKTPATVITTAVTALRATTNAAFTNAKTALANKVEVSTYYSVTRAQNPDDLLEMQDPISNVTSTAASVAAAKAEIDVEAQYANGAIQSLTLNQDTLVGTAGNDTFNANTILDPVGGINQISTLQAVDSINGGDGTDGLFVTANDAALATPTLTSVENVHVRSILAGAGVDLSAATGVQKIIAQNGSADALVTGAGAAATVGIANQVASLQVEDSTATTLGVEFTSAGNATTVAALEVVGSVATTLNITTSASNAEIVDSAAVKTVNVASTGSNKLNLSDGGAVTTIAATGTGMLDLTATPLVAVSSLTAGDGGIKFDNTGATATLTATTGAGADELTLVGGKVGTVNTGAGNDIVTTVTDGLAAASVLNVGAGDDTVTLFAVPIAGATLTGGDGTDTLAMIAATYTAVSGLAKASLDKITGFETLSITGAALAGVTDLSKIAGIVSAQGIGVDAGGASITNVGANSNIILKGDTGAAAGALTITLKDATGAADVVNVTVNQSITQNGDAVVDVFAGDANLVTTGIETVNVTSTGTRDVAVPAGAKTDVALNDIKIVDADLTTVNISGDQSFTYTVDASTTKLATINASANTGTNGNVIDLTAHAGTAGVTVTGSGVVDTITGSSKADTISAGAGADTILGAAGNDTLNGGDGADKITGGAGADTITGGAGNDTIIIAAATDSTLVSMDIIADFQANTVGQGANGAATSAGAVVAATSRNGDVIDLTAATPTALELSVQGNAADAQTFLQNAATDGAVTGVNIALDSSSSRLYIDIDNNGTVDSVIQLTGVTTITTAAFVIA